MYWHLYYYSLLAEDAQVVQWLFFSSKLRNLTRNRNSRNAIVAAMSLLETVMSKPLTKCKQSNLIENYSYPNRSWKPLGRLTVTFIKLFSTNKERVIFSNIFIWFSFSFWHLGCDKFKKFHHPKFEKNKLHHLLQWKLIFVVRLLTNVSLNYLVQTTYVKSSNSRHRAFLRANINHFSLNWLKTIQPD